ncbi:hypothetical protein ACFFOS_00805 [Nocardioides kongjuensis]|uniref:Uncharacterized protein n=1 Tax=Nocardioides kongjuensis TaxID=349522 RepID=A0A852RLV6_9ACTN|nr:hypothetical protein [Nocardioides kongjuensis]NYD29850.1 hypothetical protein [Nocardioides kongjuensis]
MPDEADGLDPTVDAVLWLTDAARSTPPPGLLARIDASVQRHGDRPDRAGLPCRPGRPGRLMTVVALALAGAFLFQATGNLVAGRWISDGIGEPYAPHAMFEMSLALLAAAVCAAAAAVRRAWGGLSVLTCTPLALSLGLHGVGELGQFAAGAALHTVEGALGVTLLGVWWWQWRDTRRRSREGGP